MRVARLILPVAVALVAVVWMTVAAAADVVSGVESQGNEYVSRDRILLGFGVRVGDELKPESVREGIRRLYEMGHFSDVRVEAEPTGEGSVRLIVIVEERPKIASSRPLETSPSRAARAPRASIDARPRRLPSRESSAR